MVDSMRACEPRGLEKAMPVIVWGTVSPGDFGWLYDVSERVHLRLMVRDPEVYCI